MFTIVDVVLEVNPDSSPLLQYPVNNSTQRELPDFPNIQKVSQLHFMSMQIFEDLHFDPLFIFENNFDGASAAYWTDILAVIGDDLRCFVRKKQKSQITNSHQNSHQTNLAPRKSRGQPLISLLESCGAGRGRTLEDIDNK
jgi:hypothetical protein